MTTLVITISLDNDAFQNEEEMVNTAMVSYVLNQVVTEIQNGQKVYEGLRDINGNYVGSYAIMDETVDELMED
jgi:hypothetical protein